MVRRDGSMRAACAFLAAALVGCGGRATYVVARVPVEVIGDHSSRPMPDPIEHALAAWRAATADERTRRADWSVSDEPGAAELRGVALGRGPRAALARFALRAIHAAHRASSAPSDTVALERLIEVAGSRVGGDPGFAALASVLSLEVAADALATSDPGIDEAWWLDELADAIDVHIERVHADGSEASRLNRPQVERAVERARNAARRWIEVRGFAPDQG